MNNRVVYTCITGDYDNIRQPLTIYKDYDYICFSDAIKEKQVGIWQIKTIPYQNKDNTMIARYVKHNPHIVIPEYEYSVWIDSNVRILDNYLETRVELMIANGSKIAHIVHPYRNCIYNEAACCLKNVRDNFDSVYRLIKFIRSDGFPHNYGLSETNIIYRKHNDSLVKNLSQKWWYMILNYSKRDQLSLYYILWKYQYKVDLLFPSEINTYSKEHFDRVYHKVNKTLLKRIKTKYISLKNRLLMNIHNDVFNL